MSHDMRAGVRNADVMAAAVVAADDVAVNSAFAVVVAVAVDAVVNDDVVDAETVGAGDDVVVRLLDYDYQFLLRFLLPAADVVSPQVDAPFLAKYDFCARDA
jgi:hypothetical protein